MIYNFSVSWDEDGETRVLRIDGTCAVVGWIEQGRRFVGAFGRTFSEWRFVPNDAEHEPYEVHTSISEAYADARHFVATSPPPQVAAVLRDREVVGDVAAAS